MSSKSGGEINDILGEMDFGEHWLVLPTEAGTKTQLREFYNQLAQRYIEQGGYSVTITPADFGLPRLHDHRHLVVHPSEKKPSFFNQEGDFVLNERLKWQVQVFLELMNKGWSKDQGLAVISLATGKIAERARNPELLFFWEVLLGELLDNPNILLASNTNFGAGKRKLKQLVSLLEEAELFYSCTWPLSSLDKIGGKRQYLTFLMLRSLIRSHCAFVVLDGEAARLGITAYEYLQERYKYTRFPPLVKSMLGQLLDEIELNPRQKKAIRYLVEEGRITNREYRLQADTSHDTAHKDLKDLMERGVIERQGAGGGTYYQLAADISTSPDSLLATAKGTKPVGEVDYKRLVEEVTQALESREETPIDFLRDTMSQMALDLYSKAPASSGQWEQDFELSFEEPKQLGSQLKALRQAYGLTQEELSDKSGIGRATLSYFEQGERKPNLGHLTNYLTTLMNLQE